MLAIAGRVGHKAGDDPNQGQDSDLSGGKGLDGKAEAKGLAPDAVPLFSSGVAAAAAALALTALGTPLGKAIAVGR